MRLYITEKNELATALMNALGGGFTYNNGYYQHPVKNEIVISCFGHMLSLCDPDEYDKKYEYWDMEHLPIPPFLPPKRKIADGKEKKVRLIGDLLKKADEIVHVGDPDEEGQLIVDELLRYFKSTKPVMRLMVNDNTKAVMQKALANMKPNSQFEHLGWIAESRAIADQLFGYNLTRAYSLNEQAKTGDRVVLHIGRVQTPILGLVVRRDRENTSHKKSFYYTVSGEFVFGGLVFVARYQTKNLDPIDEKGRLIDKDFANNIAIMTSNKPAVLSVAQTTPKSQVAPLPYNLIKLQQDAKRMYGISSDKTLEITQSLRDKHQLITYNRSDCQYLNDEQFDDVSGVISAIMNTLPNSSNVCQKANINQKGRMFNSSKVSAHHAIIPTQQSADWQALSTDEQNIYRLISRSYLAQFYPPYEYDETRLIVDVTVDGTTYQFLCVSRVDKAIGWKWLYSKDLTNEETAVDEETQFVDLRALQVGNQGFSNQISSTEQTTKPKPLYTEESLLGDLTRVAKYIKDPYLAQVLKDKDKDKEGEHGGIGTPATRSDILKKLREGGYLEDKGKYLVSTDKGQALYDLLGDQIRYPDLTAIWHDRAKDIRTQADVVSFVNQMAKDIEPIIVDIKAHYVKPTPKEKPSYPCPKCQRPMYQRKGKYGLFWGCSGWNDNENPCNHMMSDKDGVPVEKEPKAPQNLTDFLCKKCGSRLTRFDGVSKKTKKPYTKFSCSNFPKCKENYWGKDGQPDFE